MTSPTVSRSGLSDELSAAAPELGAALDAARAELLLEDPPVPDARLEALLQLGKGDAGAAVVALGPRRRTARRLAIAGGAVVTALVTTTGLAAACVLPGPVQRAVASAAAHVGLDLPVPADDDDAVAARAAPATTPATTPAPPTSGAVAATPATPPSSPAATPAAPAAPAAPATDTAKLAAFGAAVQEFRRCLIAPGANADGCTPPDPSDYGLPGSVEPPDVAGFRSAVAAYVACLRAGAVNGAVRACERPRPWDYGLGRQPVPPSLWPTPTSPPVTPPVITPPTFTPPVVTPPAGTRPTLPPRLEEFRAAVAAYVSCLRAAKGDAAAMAACARPNPRDYGLPGWPSDLPVPSSGAGNQNSSSSPVRKPPDPSPGMTTSPSTVPGGSASGRTGTSGSRH